jgi:hypothetical protein
MALPQSQISLTFYLKPAVSVENDNGHAGFDMQDSILPDVSSLKNAQTLE